MKVEVFKDQIYERKADDSGRISLPSKEFAGKKLEIAVLDEIEEGESERDEFLDKLDERLSQLVEEMFQEDDMPSQGEQHALVRLEELVEDKLDGNEG